MKQVPEGKRKTRKASAGAARHQTPSAIKAVQDVHGTEVLVGSYVGQLTVKFDPTLNFVKVQFKCDNPNIKIERGGDVGDDSGFPLEFGQNDKREATFEIKARAVEKESDEPVDISCQDINGNQLGSTRRYWIKLKPEPPPLEPPTDFKFLSWLVYAIRRSRKHPAFYALIVVVLVVPLFIFRVSPTDKIVNWVQRVNDHVQIKLHTKDPYVYEQPWSDPFLPRDNNRPDESKWLAPNEWSLVNGEKDSAVDKALRVAGDEVGLNKLPSDLYALYDYKVTFRLNTAESQRTARWIVRAQNQQDYYLFELTLPTQASNEAKLEGFVYANGARGQPLASVTSAPVEYFKLHEGDLLFVILTVKNFEFKHEFILNLHEADDENNLNFDKQADKKLKTLSDVNKTYRYGAFGFQAHDRSDPFKVEGVEIENIK